MKLEGKRVFISGGAGVIGCEMVQLLSEMGAVVMVGDLKPVPGNFPSTVRYRQGDLNEITQPEIDSFAPEVFIHLAATFERSAETYEHWEENFRHNIQLSHHLMTLMRNTPSLRRVVNASSYLIYDKQLYQFKTPSKAPYSLRENDPINPRNLTGLAKLSHEIELDFLALFKSDNFTSISARIYRGYGKNSRDVISRWVRDLLNGKEITVYNQEGFFDYIYAQDTAKGLIRLAEITQTGIVNLGTGRSRQVKDIVSVLGQSFPDMQVNYIDETDELTEASQADITLLKTLVHWAPERDLEDTIPELIAFERETMHSNEPVYGNILVTSASKKIPMIKAVITAANKISTQIRVIAGDLDKRCLAQHFAHDFWQMPRLAELQGMDLVHACKERNVQLIIPSRDGELPYFAQHKALLAENGIHVMVSDPTAIDNCIDKLAFYATADQLTQPYLIPAHDNVEAVKSERYVVKERFGAGALSIGIDLSKEEAIVHARKLDSPIFQPFISGYELSIDAYIDRKHNLKGIVMRRRELVINGESQITTTVENPELEQQFTKIIGQLGLSGHIILQAMIDDSGAIHVVECNPRFGGASTLSVKAGLDSFYWFYLETTGTDIQPYPFHKWPKPLTQIRYPNDLYL